MEIEQILDVINKARSLDEARPFVNQLREFSILEQANAIKNKKFCPTKCSRK